MRLVFFSPPCISLCECARVCVVCVYMSVSVFVLVSLCIECVCRFVSVWVYTCRFSLLPVLDPEESVTEVSGTHIACICNGNAYLP